MARRNQRRRGKGRKVAEEGDEECAEESAEEGAEEVAEEGDEEGAEESAEEGAEESAKEGAEEGAKEGAEESAEVMAGYDRSSICNVVLGSDVMDEAVDSASLVDALLRLKCTSVKRLKAMGSCDVSTLSQVLGGKIGMMDVILLFNRIKIFVDGGGASNKGQPGDGGGTTIPVSAPPPVKKKKKTKLSRKGNLDKLIYASAFLGFDSCSTSLY